MCDELVSGELVSICVLAIRRLWEPHQLAPDLAGMDWSRASYDMRNTPPTTGAPR